jgi:hypothetical protein
MFSTQTQNWDYCAEYTHAYFPDQSSHDESQEVGPEETFMFRRIEALEE